MRARRRFPATTPLAPKMTQTNNAARRPTPNANAKVQNAPRARARLAQPAGVYPVAEHAAESVYPAAEHAEAPGDVSD